MGRSAVRAARVFDGEQVLEGPVAVLVEDVRTVGMDPRGTVPDGWPVTDLPSATILPGHDASQLTEDELRAVVSEARAHGLPTTAHAHALSAVEQAIRAGVDGIEHCTCLTATGVEISDDLLASLAESGTVVCPTLGADPAVVVPPEIVALAARAGVTEESLRRVAGLVHGAGVAFVAGSDGGIGPAKPHGLLPLTLAEYVAAGMPAGAALTAATSAAADSIGATTKGRIRPGHDADLLVVDGDPVVDITALQRPLAVYLAGEPGAIMG